MQMKSTMTFSELMPCFRKRFARKSMAAVSSDILFFMSAYSHGYPTCLWAILSCLPTVTYRKLEHFVVVKTDLFAHS